MVIFLDAYINRVPQAPYVGLKVEDIIKAANALINGSPPVENQMPSAGCNIKWIPGQEPDYF